MGNWDLRYLITRYTKPVELASLIPEDLPITPKDIQPRLKDGGSFLRFTYNPTQLTLPDIETAVNLHLKKDFHRPWFNPWSRICCYIVKGKPWVEDLNRFPSYSLKVVFDGNVMPEETIYSKFRKYGRIKEITESPKESPPFVSVVYDRLRSATSAKNCLHGYQCDDTKLHIMFENRRRAHIIRDWIVNHPRITVPIGAALLAALTVAIFDPIRVWFIKTHVTQAWNFENSKIAKWITRYTFSFMGVKQQQQDSMWSDERSELVEKLRGYLSDSSSTFIIVQGPRGSGKRELVIDTVLKDRPNVLTIDCESIISEHGETQKLKSLASQVGYWPLFSWFNGISSMMDLAAQGVIGSKPGFSETLDAQIVNILEMTSIALKRIALADKRKDKEYRKMRDETYLETNPDKRPVIVIDNYLFRGEGSEVFYDSIAKWTAELVQSNIAHVVFIGNDVAMSKNLSKALPSRMHNIVILGDADISSAKKYVLRKLSDDSHKEIDNEELTNAIQLLGGRLTDLETLSQHVGIGESPTEAVNDIVANSTSEILKFYFLSGNETRPWTNEQAWLICKTLAEKENISYNKILLDRVFDGNEESLKAMEQSELIVIVSRNGRPAYIVPGRPVYRAAFRRIVGDRVFAANQELTMLKNETKKSSGKIQDIETELQKLSKFPSQPWEIQKRMRYLLSKLYAEQDLVDRMDVQIKENKAIISKE